MSHLYRQDTSPPRGSYSGGGSNNSHSLQNQLARREEELAEMIDEVGKLEQALDEAKAESAQALQHARNKEAAMTTLCDKVLTYAARLEQQVIIPSVGSVTAALADFHEVAAARNEANAATEALVNSYNHPRLAALFNSMQKPAPRTAQDAFRRSKTLAGRVSLDQAYDMSLILASENEALLDLLRAMSTSAAIIHRESSYDKHGADHRQQAAPYQQPAAPHHDDGYRHQQQYRRDPEDEERIAELSHEVQRLKYRLEQAEHASPQSRHSGGGASNHGGSLDAMAMQQQLEGVKAEKRVLEEQNRTLRNDAMLLQERVDAVQSQLRSLEQQNDSLNHRMTLQAQGSNDALYAQLRGENEMLRSKLSDAEQIIAQNKEDRAAVAIRFETIQRALENAGKSENAQLAAAVKEAERLRVENAQLEDDVHDLTERLKESKVREDEKMRRLHKEKLLLQQELNNALASKESGVESFLQQVHRSQSDEAADAIGHAVSETVTAQQYQSKIKAFEMTIAALNSELAHLEDNVIETQKKAEADRNQMQSEYEQERRRLLAEQEECDRVLDRLNSELERVLQENEDLRQRLRGNASAKPVPLAPGTYPAPPGRANGPVPLPAS